MKTIGLDISDNRTHLCMLDDDGTVVFAQTLPTTVSSVHKYFCELEPCRVVLEVGPHSRWMSFTISQLGHEVIVANPAKIPTIARAKNKSDARDAQHLAQLGRVDPRLLCPVDHRSEAAHADLMVIRARALVVGQRTAVINHLRGVLKAAGVKVPTKTTPTRLPDVVAELVPPMLLPAVQPLLTLLLQLKEHLRGYDKAITQLAESLYPQTRRLTSITGVGDVTALAFVLTIERPERFNSPRDVAAYLGLTPARSQSGALDPRLGITKAGDRLVRTLLVNCAQYILGPFGQESRLRAWGLELAARSGSKKKAAVAVARKLSVIMLALWRTQQDFIPAGC